MTLDSKTTWRFEASTPRPSSSAPCALRSSWRRMAWRFPQSATTSRSSRTSYFSGTECFSQSHPVRREGVAMTYMCAHCYSNFAGRRHRVGTIMFCTRLCRLRWEHKLKEFERAQKRWFDYLARGT